MHSFLAQISPFVILLALLIIPHATDACLACGLHVKCTPCTLIGGGMFPRKKDPRDG